MRRPTRYFAATTWFLARAETSFAVAQAADSRRRQVRWALASLGWARVASALAFFGEALCLRSHR